MVMQHRDITKLNMYHELLANRYLLSVVLTNLMSTNRMLETLLKSTICKKERKEEQKEKGFHTFLKERKEEKKERNNPTIEFSDKIEFNSFTLSQTKFDQLLRTYDHDVVIDSCVILDKLIGVQGKAFKNIPRKLEELCKQLSLREKLVDTLAVTAKELRQIDYHQIEDVEMAKKFIFATPGYIRNVDEGCKYLSEKFNIDLERARKVV